MKSYISVKSMPAMVLYTVKLAAYNLSDFPLISIGSLNGLMLLLSTMTSLLLVRAIPRIDYGQLVYFFAAFGLIRLALNLGLGLKVTQDISVRPNDFDKLTRIFYSLAGVSGSSVIIGGALLIGISLFIDRPFLIYATIAAMLASLADFVFAVIAGLRRNRSIAIMTLVQPIVYFLLALVLVRMSIAKPRDLMLVYSFSFGLMLVAGIVLIRRAGLLNQPQRGFFEISYIRRILSFVIASYLASLLSQAWLSLAYGGLGWSKRFEAAAGFGIVITAVTIPVSIAAVTLMTTYYPRFSYAMSNGNRQASLKEARTTVTLLGAALVWIAMLLFVFAEVIVSILFGQTYADTATYLRLMAPVTLVAGLIPFFTLSLFAGGWAWRALIALAVQAVTLFVVFVIAGGNISLNTLSWAVFLSTTLALLIQWSIATFTLKDPLAATSLFKIITLGIVLAFVGRLLTPGEVDWPMLWQLLLAGIMTVVYGFNIIFLCRRDLWEKAQLNQQEQHMIAIGEKK